MKLTAFEIELLLAGGLLWFMIASYTSPKIQKLLSYLNRFDPARFFLVLFMGYIVLFLIWG